MRTSLLLLSLAACGRTPADLELVAPGVPEVSTDAGAVVMQSAPRPLPCAPPSRRRVPLEALGPVAPATPLTADAARVLPVTTSRGNNGVLAVSATDGGTWLVVAAAPDATLAGTRLLEGVQVVKLSATGAVETRFSTGVNVAQLAVSPRGVLLVAGSFTGTLTVQGRVLTSGGASDVALLGFTPAGQLLWARSVGSASSDTARPVAVDSEGNFLVTANLGPNALVQSVRASDGAVQWSNQDLVLNAGSVQLGPVRAVLDVPGGVAIAGKFGSLRVGSQPVVTAGLPEGAFVVKFDREGRLLWLRTVKGSCIGWGSTGANGLSHDGERLLVTGSYCTGLDLGDGVKLGAGSTFLWELDLASGVTRGGAALGTASSGQFSAVDAWGRVSILTGNWGGAVAMLYRWDERGRPEAPVTLTGSPSALVADRCGALTAVVETYQAGPLGSADITLPPMTRTAVTLQFDPL
ncbi:MAG: hypothetical protein GQE15_31270 [Archangiaceae bacterium]|nr:hypothetical protein [Archangiaceae bacterium]